MWQGHETARARHGMSRTVPFDLHALAPVPPPVLRLGHDAPDALAWCWQHWGTTWPLRQVEEIPGPGWTLHFWSADWKPWPVLAAIQTRWPSLGITVKADYR